MSEILTHPMFYVALLVVSAATAAEIKRFRADGKPVSAKAKSEMIDTLATLTKKK